MVDPLEFEKFWTRYYNPENGHEKLEELLGERGRILEIGCGAGRQTEVLCEIVEDVYAIDRDRKGVYYTRDRCDASVFVADAQKLPFTKDVFDATVFSWSFFLIGDKKRALKEAIRTSNSTATCLLIEPSSQSEVDALKPDHLCSPYKSRERNRETLELIQEFGYKPNKETVQTHHDYPSKEIAYDHMLKEMDYEDISVDEQAKEKLWRKIQDKETPSVTEASDFIYFRK